jgi:DNA-binding transcriptional MerR regulator
MDQQLLSIGRFARRCRLSVKQLRQNDELGLLRPAWVDPGSGYRYYRAEQAREALSIGLLRSLEVPLPAIGQVLAGSDVVAVLGAVKDRLEADLVRRRHALATLQQVLTEGLPRAQVRLTHQDARRLAVTSAVATVEEIGPVTSDCVARLGQALAAAGRQPGGPLMGLFPLDLTDQVTVRVAAEVDQDVAGTAGEVLGGGRFAVATHLGPTTSSRSPPTPCWPGSASTGTRSAVACASSTSPIRSAPPRSSW